MEPGSSMPHSEVVFNNPCPGIINIASLTNTHFFNIYSNINLSFMLGSPSVGFPAKILKIFPYSLIQTPASFFSYNNPGYII